MSQRKVYDEEKIRKEIGLILFTTHVIRGHRLQRVFNQRIQDN